MKKILIILFGNFLSMTFINAQQTVGLFTNTTDAFDGYTLFAPINSFETYLINNCGEKVHSWTSNYLPGLSCYLLEDGTLLRTGKITGIGPGNSSGIIEMIDWDGNVIWDFDAAATHGRQHHDIQMMPNGNILSIVFDKKFQTDVIAAGSTTSSNFINSEQIIEIQPDLITGGATVVWEWKAWDHLIQDIDSSKPNFGNVSQNNGKIDLNYLTHSTIDWLHFNSVDYNEEFDQIIISVRNFSEFWVIDHSTSITEAASSSGGTYGKGGDLLYRWGNPEAFDQGTTADQKLFRPHHAYWIPPSLDEAGKVLIFNNQAGTLQGLDYSTVNIVEPQVDANGVYTNSGGAFGPNSFSWTYQAPNPTDFFSNVLSGVQRLENGNTLICEGVGGRFFEIDPNGNIVWEYVNPINGQGAITQQTPISDNNVFRCTRYAPDYAGFDGKTLTTQGYLEIGSTFACNLYGCIDPIADNYDSAANADDGSCVYSNGIVSVELVALLEGAIIDNSTMMRAALVENGLLPTTQPYETAPYNHTETNATNSNINLNVVDWILVEARYGDPNSGSLTLQEARAGLLLEDGSIVHYSGSGPLEFETLETGIDYYFTVRHRNHLDIISNTPISIATNLVQYDFRNSDAYGLNQQKVISGTGFSVNALFAGSYKSNDVIQTTDFDEWKNNPAILNVYSNTDGNLDGSVQTTDYDVWEINKAKVGTGLFD